MNTSWYYRPTNSTRYASLKDHGIGSATSGRPLSRSTSTINKNKGGNATSLTGQRNLQSGTNSKSGGIKRQSPEEYKIWLNELRRPTESTEHRFSAPKNSYHYSHRFISVDGTSYQWHKIDIMNDTYKTLWNKYGLVKNTFTK